MGIIFPVYLDGIMNVFMKTAFALARISEGLMRTVDREKTTVQSLGKKELGLAQVLLFYSWDLRVIQSDP